MVILTVICVIFYTVLQYYATSVLGETSNAALIERVMALRMLFSGLFCLLLGFMGVKLTGHVWPAVLVHTAAVLLLLLLDIPWNTMVQEWEITALILAAVAALTGVAGGITLALVWLRIKYPSPRRHGRRM